MNRKNRMPTRLLASELEILEMLWRVGKATIVEAHRLVGSAPGRPVSPTGTAGVAGLLTAIRDGRVGPDDHVVVLLTGVGHGREAGP